MTKTIKKEIKVSKTNIKELELKFDKLTDELMGNEGKGIKPKAYELKLQENSLSYLKNLLLKGEWKGFQEATQLNFINEFLKTKSDKIETLKNDLKLTWNELNVFYSYIKNVSGSGINEALSYFELLNDVSIPMEQVLKDQQEHKNLALELQAAENGITVEQLSNSINSL